VTRNELISIVVPIYNVEEYLPECLDSLLAQTHDNIEIVCVDDCTKDRSADIVMDYMEKDRRVRLIRHTVNQGLGPARNSGIKDCAGEIIGFIDSDDWVKPDMFEKLYAAMRDTDADIVQCSALRMKNGRPLNSYPNSEGTRSVNLLTSMFGMDPCFVGAAWNKLYKKSLFIDNDIYYPPIYFEDVATTPRLLNNARTIVSLKESYLYYRYREDSIVNHISAAKFRQRVDGLIEGIKILSDYFSARGKYPLQFIINFRLYFRSQLISNLKLMNGGPAEKFPLNESAIYILHKLYENESAISYFVPSLAPFISSLKIGDAP